MRIASDVGAITRPPCHGAVERHREWLAAADSENSRKLPAAKQFVRETRQFECAASAERKVIRIVSGRDVMRNKIRVPAIQERAEAIHGRCDSEWLLRQ